MQRSATPQEQSRMLRDSAIFGAARSTTVTDPSLYPLSLENRHGGARHSGPLAWTDTDRRGDPSAGACLLRCAASKGERYMTIAATHIPLGHSGLKVTPLWLGTMMFGDQTDEAEAGRIVAAARDGRRQRHRQRRFVCQGRVGAHRRPPDRARSRALGAREQGRESGERGPQPARPVATLVAAGRRAQPRSAWAPTGSTCTTCTATTRTRRSRRRCRRWRG